MDHLHPVGSGNPLPHKCMLTIADYNVAEVICVKYGGACVLQECCPHKYYVLNQCGTSGHVCCLYEADCQWEEHLNGTTLSLCISLIISSDCYHWFHNVGYICLVLEGMSWQDWQV